MREARAISDVFIIPVIRPYMTSLTQEGAWREGVKKAEELAIQNCIPLARVFCRDVEVLVVLRGPFSMRLPAEMTTGWYRGPSSLNSKVFSRTAAEMVSWAYSLVEAALMATM